MLRKYITSKNQMFLPDLTERYLISITGEITDIFHYKIIVPDSTGQVEIIYNENIVRVPLYWVIAMAFKPLYRSRTFSLNWDIVFADGKQDNIHPSNLMWKPPKGGQPCPEMIGFFIIPGISNAAINNKGLIYSRIHDRYLKIRSSSNTYLVFTGRTDNFASDPIPNSIGTFGVHRAIGLAMIDYDDWINVGRMQINHMDGDKLNNDIPNLEWSTNGENVIHAYANGLNSQINNSIKVIGLDERNNEIRKYISVTQACKFLGISRDMLVFWSETNFRDRNGLTYKLEYPEVKEIRTCIAVSLGYDKNNERVILEAPSPFTMAKITNTTVDKINTALSTCKQFPSDNFMYYLKEDYECLLKAGELRQFTDLEIEAFRNRSGITRPILVTWLETGKKQVFKSISVFDNDPILSKLYPSRCVYPGYHIKDFTFEYIDN